MKNRELHCPKLGSKLKFVAEVIGGIIEVLVVHCRRAEEEGGKLVQVEVIEG